MLAKEELVLSVHLTYFTLELLKVQIRLSVCLNNKDKALAHLKENVTAIA